MIRVLHVLGCTDRGGAETLLMNIYRTIDRSKLQFDFVVHTEAQGAFDDEIIALGGRIFSVPRFRGTNLVAYSKAWKKLLNEHPEWNIVHGHVRSTAAIYLKIAKNANRFTIAHSHSTSSGTGTAALVKSLLQYPIRYIADYYMACSQEAGEWLFGRHVCAGNRFTVLNNGIDTHVFQYDAVVRSQLRRELSLENCYTIGHVGNFREAKNHGFLLRVFAEVKKLCPEAKLLLIGAGPLRDSIVTQIDKLSLHNHVVLLGSRDDVPQLLQAMDAFLFPSVWEGFGVALLEAQAAGLPILASTAVKEYAVASELFVTLPLSETPKSWAEKLIENASPNNRQEYAAKIREAGFDISETVEWLQRFYLNQV